MRGQGRNLSPLASSLLHTASLLGFREVSAHSSRIVAMTNVEAGSRVPASRIVAVPTGDNDPESVSAMVEEGIRQLSRISSVDLAAVRSVIENGNADVFKFRLSAADSGSIPLSQLPSMATALSRMMRDLAKASFDELEIRDNPVDYNARNGFLDHLHAGQTERGSYVVTVLSSLEPSPELARSLNLAMTRQLVDLAQQIRQVLDEHVDTETAAWTSRSRTGILGDTCAQLGHLIEQSRSGVDVRFSPSPLMRADLGEAKTTAPFPRLTAETLYEFATILSPPPDPVTHVLLKGLVTDTHQEPEPGDVGTYFKIRGKVLEGRARGELRTIRVHVGRDQLPAILQAFERKHPILVRGQLDPTTGHQWAIRQPERLDPLPDEGWEDVFPASRRARSRTEARRTRLIREEGPLFMVRQLVAMGLLDTPMSRQEIDDLIEEREGFAFGPSALSGAITRAIDAGIIQKRRTHGNVYEYLRSGVDWESPGRTTDTAENDIEN